MATRAVGRTPGERGGFLELMREKTAVPSTQHPAQRGLFIKWESSWLDLEGSRTKRLGSFSRVLEGAGERGKTRPGMYWVAAGWPAPWHSVWCQPAAPTSSSPGLLPRPEGFGQL